MQTKSSFRHKISTLSLLTCMFLLAGLSVGAQQDTATSSKKLVVVKKQTGKSLLYTEPGKYKLYATFVNNKATNYYAIDNNGKRTDATFKANQAGIDPIMTCKVCVTLGGKQHCWDISCDDVPKPKETKAQ